MRCFACGGRKESDASIREKKGCDKDLPRGRQHIIARGGGLEPLKVSRCPRQLIKGVSHFFNTYNWAQKGLLHYQYDPDEFPAKYAEAIDLIDSELDEKHRIQAEAAKKENK